MNITEIVMLCSNLEYMERFSRYLRLSQWDRQVRVHQFSSLETLERYCQAGGQAHVVLCEKQWHEGCTQLFHTDHTYIAVITDQAVHPVADGHELKMYQPVSRLLAHLERVRVEKEPTGLPEQPVPMRHKTASSQPDSMVIIAVTSPYGGSGVTTIACHLAKLLAMRMDKVLYLHLNLYPEPVMVADVEYDFSRMLYALLTRPERLTREWQQYCSRFPTTGVYTFRPPVIRRDLRDVKIEHIHRICELFRDIGFQAVVLDLDAHWLDDLVEGKLHADECWMVAPWQRRDWKHFPHLRSFTERSHVRVILNQVNGPQPVPSVAEDPNIEAVLPHMGVRGTADEPYQSSELFESIITRLILHSPVLGGVAHDD